MMPIGVLSILILLVLLASLAAGVILIITSRRGGLGYPACGACKYDLSGTIGSATRCPECGAEIASAGIIPPKGRRNVGQIWVGVALVALPMTCLGVAFLGATVHTARSVQTQRAAQAAATQAAATNAQLQPNTAPETDPNASDASSQAQPITSEEQ